MMSMAVGSMKITPTKYIKVHSSPRAIRNKFYELQKLGQNNDIIAKAIQSLDSLNDQIVNYVYSPRSEGVENEFCPKDREALKSSLSLMRRLLVDAQMRFRKMVEDNRKLATRIDGSIQTANKEMFMLRQELDDTNRRLIQIRDTQVVNAPVDKKTKRTPSNASLENMRRADTDNQIIQLKEENSRMETELNKLRTEIIELRAAKRALSDQPSLSNLKVELLQYQNELVRAKDSLQGLKTDRKRLKAEKVDLLCRMKGLYESIEDKETELKDFIQKYETQGKQTEQTIKQLEACEQEKWALIRRANVAAETCVRLQAELNERDAEMLILRHKLDQAQDQIRELTSGTASMDKTSDSSRPESGLLSLSMRSNDTLDTSERTSSTEDINKNKKLRKTKKSFGSLSKMFTKVKNRRSIAIGEVPTIGDQLQQMSLDVLSADNVNEKVQTARQLRHVHVNEWTSQQVLAWLEITMNMPQYGWLCAKNIRSGKVLAELSDADLDSSLGMTDYMHRKKLRLAIHELKTGNGEHAKAGDLDPMWICEVWLPDIGLPQYRPVFDRSLVDGRVLVNLTRRELEKYMNITDKLHQNSILTAALLLQHVKCDKQVLSQKRSESLASINNPLMWSNQQTREWVEKFMPEERIHDMKESGVHGALLVLEPSCTADSIAAVLGITGDKKKRFSSEFDKLIKPARSSPDCASISFERSTRSEGNPMKRISLRGSLGRAFGRKLKPSLIQEENGETIRSSKRSHSHEHILNKD